MDNLYEAAQIAEGVRKNMMVIENSSIKQIQEDLFIIYITALEKIVSLINSTLDTLKDEVL